MRFLLLSAIAALCLSGCAVEFEYGHHYHPHGHWEYHRGHSHHYWNRAGEVYGEAAHIRSLVVLPVKLPATFKGQFSSPDEDRWRRDWPMKGADIIARRIASTGDLHIAATSSDKQPTEGYYLLLEISDLDVGSLSNITSSSADSAAQELKGWCYFVGTGRIYNAKSGKEVVELTFDQAMARFNETPPFEALMFATGMDLCEWFREKQAAKNFSGGAGSDK